jgi:hypothetical protein
MHYLFDSAIKGGFVNELPDDLFSDRQVVQMMPPTSSKRAPH